MSNLKDLIAQREELEGKISELQKQEHADSVAKVHAIISEFGLTQKDIFGIVGSRNKVKSSSGKVAAKYRDPDSGKEWSGRGLAPKWMNGKSKAEFLIPANS